MASLTQEEKQRALHLFVSGQKEEMYKHLTETVLTRPYEISFAHKQAFEKGFETCLELLNVIASSTLISKRLEKE